MHCQIIQQESWNIFVDYNCYNHHGGFCINVVSLVQATSCVVMHLVYHKEIPPNKYICRFFLKYNEGVCIIIDIEDIDDSDHDLVELKSCLWNTFLYNYLFVVQ